MAHVALLGVRAALAVLAEVVPQEAVEHGGVGGGEVPVDAFAVIHRSSARAAKT